MGEEQKHAPETGSLDLPSTDLARTADFYGRLFDWSFEGDETSLTFRNQENHVGSFHRVETMPDPGPRPLPLIAVSSIDHVLQAVIELDGGIVEPKRNLEDIGWMARIADPDGNILGLIEIAEAHDA